MTLDPLRDVPDVQVIVVDNSSDSEVARVAQATGANYVDAGANRGFAAGVNIGARCAVPNADLLLLNPDAVITPESIDALVTALRADPGLAAVTPALIGADGDLQRAIWPLPTPGRAWRAAFSPRWTGPGDFLVGACLLIARRAWDDVGAFDERFFLYAEETDWQRRAALNGWQVAVATDVMAE